VGWFFELLIIVSFGYLKYIGIKELPGFMKEPAVF
jgi:hypothetical protein